MKVIKKYLLIEIWSSKLDDKLVPRFSYGELEYGDSPNYIFDTEQEAIEAAYIRSPYSHWLVIPRITFNNFNEI